jgi:hypothetical protein
MSLKYVFCYSVFPPVFHDCFSSRKYLRERAELRGGQRRLEDKIKGSWWSRKL